MIWGFTRFPQNIIRKTVVFTETKRETYKCVIYINLKKQ